MNDRFETAVERMLADVAKVDAATLAETRASIATLPDRTSPRTARFGLRLPRLSARRSPALSLAGVALLLVAIVAVSLFGRFQSAPVGPGSPTSTTATPHATGTVAPSHAPSPTATDRPPQAFHETLPDVYTGESLSMLGWSPDGSSFAILEQPRGSAFAPPVRSVHIFDRAGDEIESVQAERFAWLSASNFVILRADAAGSGGVVEAYMGWVGTPQLTALGSYDNLVAGPSGEVALTLPWDWTITPPPQYVVVSASGSVSEPRDGYPAAWSRDGSMLAVYHITGPTGPLGIGSRPFGWIEVVRSTGESVASARQSESDMTGQAAFCPDGTRVAFRGRTNAASNGEQIGVLDVASGRLATVPKFGPFTWASSDDLLLVDSSSDLPSANGSVLSWSAATGLMASYGTGNIVGASGQGVVVVGSDVTHEFTWTNTASDAGSSGSFSLGSGPLGDEFPDAAWSPDGKSLIIIVGDQVNTVFMDAVIAHF